MIITDKHIKNKWKLQRPIEGKLTFMIHVPKTAGKFRKNNFALELLLSEMNTFCEMHFGKYPNWVFFYTTECLGNIFYFSSLEDAVVFDLAWGHS